MYNPYFSHFIFKSVEIENVILYNTLYKQKIYLYRRKIWKQ